MHENTGSQRDAASTIFNLPDYHVIEAIDLPDGGRRVVIASTVPPGCPSCGVLATKVHSRRSQHVRDVPVGPPPSFGPVAVRVVGFQLMGALPSVVGA